MLGVTSEVSSVDFDLLAAGLRVNTKALIVAVPKISTHPEDAAVTVHAPCDVIPKSRGSLVHRSVDAGEPDFSVQCG